MVGIKIVKCKRILLLFMLGEQNIGSYKIGNWFSVVIHANLKELSVVMDNVS